jgi:hypothetical protein
MASHQPRPRRPAPWEPPAGLLRPPSPQEPPAGPLHPPAMLRPSAAGPHRGKPQARPPVSVRRPKCPANKNNNKIYQMKEYNNNE